MEERIPSFLHPAFPSQEPNPKLRGSSERRKNLVTIIIGTVLNFSLLSKAFLF